jgi:malonyl-ACP O-methyltransferase BioC
MKVDKELLCRQFQRAAASYEDQAEVQDRTAERLLALLLQHGTDSPQRVLEIGCCTGLLSRRLLHHFQGLDLVLNDLMPDFPSRLHLNLPSLTFLPGDIEVLPLPGCFDLIISSSTFHWLHEAEQLLARLSRHLHPKGCLAFSLYGPNTLKEIRSLTGLGLDYLSRSALVEVLEKYFVLRHHSEEEEVLYFPSPQSVLRHLQQTGVNALSRRPWQRQQFEQFCQGYQQNFSSPRGLTLTYHALYFVAEAVS